MSNYSTGAGRSPSRPRNIIRNAGTVTSNKIGPMSMPPTTTVASVVMAFPNPTLGTIQDVITSGPARYREYIRQLPPDLQLFFNTEWGTYDRTRGELKWRFRLLLENDLVRQMFSATRTRFRIAEAMDRGDVIVIENTIEKIEEDGAAFVGRFFLAQIWRAAMARSSRPRETKKPVYVYIDEADLIIREDPTIGKIIDRCRSQNIALICAFQRAAQIEDPKVRSALENCAIKMVNVDAEAAHFSNLLHIPIERMNQLPRGHFAMHERGVGSRIIRVPLARLPYRTMTEDEQQAHRQKMIDLYGYREQSYTLAGQAAPSSRSQIAETHEAPEKPKTDAPMRADNAPSTHEPPRQRTTTITLPDPHEYGVPEDHDHSKPTPWKRKQ